MADSTTFRERTRATKYQPEHPLPPRFAEMLKDYTREVLREQPANLLEWSAEYFKRLAVAEDPSIARQPPPEHYAPEVDNPEVEATAQQISKVFGSIDADSTGRLYVHLVKRALLEALQLTRDQALYILSSEFVNVEDDGAMEYRQFSRDCVNPILFFQQSNFAFEPVEHTDAGPAVHGMLERELTDELVRVLRSADEEGLGRLPYGQYRRALVSAPIQLTRRDINVLCAEAEQTSGGFIDFVAEAGKAFELLLLSQSFAAFDEQNNA